MNTGMNEEMFLLQKSRLRRILARCGWTPSLNKKSSGVYAGAVKRDETGKLHSTYIAPMHRLDKMDTAEIKAVLPEIA